MKRIKNFNLFEEDAYHASMTSKKTNCKVLFKAFKELYENGIPLKKTDVPDDILNIYPEYVDEEIYSGHEVGKNPDEIRSWTTDEETAEAFSKKYKKGKVYSMTSKEFDKKFIFVSFDVLVDYLLDSGVEGIDTDYLEDKYASESEIYVIELKKIKKK